MRNNPGETRSPWEGNVQVIRASSRWLAIVRLIAAVAVLLAVSAFVDCSTARASETAVDLELVLAVDASLSVDAEEAQLQRQGYIAALTDPRTIKAIQAGEHGRIAVFYFEWASEFYQRVIVDWTLIEDEASARAVADMIAATPYRGERRTSISGAIRYGADLFGQRYKGERQVIDISGDGRNNSGPPIEESRAEALARGITINGLPILNDKPTFMGRGYGYGPDPYLDHYYQDSVIGGPGSFMIPAESFKSFDQAILSKLIREIAGTTTGGSRFAANAPAERRSTHRRHHELGP
jgi:hypothetical protein